MLPPSSDELVKFQAPPFSEQAARFFHAPEFSVDALLEAPVSEHDALMLSDLFTDEEVAAMLAGRQLAVPLPKKRKRPLPPQRPSSSSATAAAGSPAQQVLRRPAKKARRPVGWGHKEIASRILTRRFRARELSRGRTKLRCQCSELAAVDRSCALHQDAGDGGEEWARQVRRRVPIAAGPGEVRVPTMVRKDGAAMVMHYMRWRRGVWMPTRFYLEHAAERGVDQWMSRWMTG